MEEAQIQKSIDRVENGLKLLYNKYTKAKILRKRVIAAITAQKVKLEHSEEESIFGDCINLFAIATIIEILF
jgi:hypothetical protein